VWLSFFDDILIYSNSYEEHLHQVLTLLAKDKWVVKLKKCQFARQEIHYLGHILSGQGVHTDPEMVKAVQQWPTPTNARELRGFLGLAGFYRKFVRHFAVLAKPLTNLLKKNTLFIWTSEHQEAFDVLKQALCTAPVLGIPDFSQDRRLPDWGWRCPSSRRPPFGLHQQTTGVQDSRPVHVREGVLGDFDRS
jgi:hypothetical protein